AVRAEWFRRYVELLSAQLREASGGRVGSLAVAADDPSLLSTLAQVRADPRVALAVVSAHRLINLPLRAEWKQRMARAASEERCETQTFALFLPPYAVEHVLAHGLAARSKDSLLQAMLTPRARVEIDGSRRVGGGSRVNVGWLRMVLCGVDAHAQLPHPWLDFALSRWCDSCLTAADTPADSLPRATRMAAVAKGAGVVTLPLVRCREVSGGFGEATSEAMMFAEEEAEMLYEQLELDGESSNTANVTGQEPCEEEVGLNLMLLCSAIAPADRTDDNWPPSESIFTSDPSALLPLYLLQYQLGPAEEPDVLSDLMVLYSSLTPLTN
ncbi:MAG: hypothetical protein SGPRY_012547, partial [Prymnesium sp.]